MIAHLPESTSRSVVRERSFRMYSLRSDFADAIAQLVTLFYQLRRERLTGVVQIHMGQGGVNSVSVRDSQKIPVDTD